MRASFAVTAIGANTAIGSAVGVIGLGAAVNNGAAFEGCPQQGSLQWFGACTAGVSCIALRLQHIFALPVRQHSMPTGTSVTPSASIGMACTKRNNASIQRLVKRRFVKENDTETQ